MTRRWWRLRRRLPARARARSGSLPVRAACAPARAPSQLQPRRPRWFGGLPAGPSVRRVPLRRWAQLQEPATKENTSSVASACINLTKNLIGSGLFSLPTALLQGSLVPGICTMLFAALAQGSSFVLIAFLCQRLGHSSYRGVCSSAFGKRGGDLVDLCIVTNSFFACVAYNILVADFLQKSLEGLFGWVAAPRPLLIWAATLTFMMPLSHVRNLAPLRYTSILGLAIIGFVFLKVTNDFVINFAIAGPILQQHFGYLSMGLFTTLALSTSAFAAHYNAPRLFKELGSDLKAHKRTVIISFGSAFVIYAIFAVAGLGLFGDKLFGNVLKNYTAEGNVGMLLAWLGMAFAMMFTYPLVFTTGRDSLIGLFPALQRAGVRSPTRSHVAITSVSVAIVAVVACFVEDVSVVGGLLGATVGACICWIFPASVYLKAVAPPLRRGALEEPLLPGRPPRAALGMNSGLLRTYAVGMVVVGFTSMIVGIGKALRVL